MDPCVGDHSRASWGPRRKALLPLAGSVPSLHSALLCKPEVLVTKGPGLSVTRCPSPQMLAPTAPPLLPVRSLHSVPILRVPLTSFLPLHPPRPVAGLPPCLRSSADPSAGGAASSPTSSPARPPPYLLGASGNVPSYSSPWRWGLWGKETECRLLGRSVRRRPSGDAMRDYLLQFSIAASQSP